MARYAEWNAGRSTRRDLYFQLNIATLRARMLLAQQQPADALKMLGPDLPGCPIPTMYGEYLATRAVALAVSAGAQPQRALLMKQPSSRRTLMSDCLALALA